MTKFYNRHYITINDRSRIIFGQSDGPHPDLDTANAICINEQGGYQFRLRSGGGENPTLQAMDGIPLYHWNGEQVVPRTEAETNADRAAIPIRTAAGRCGLVML